MIKEMETSFIKIGTMQPAAEREENGETQENDFPKLTKGLD